MESECRPVLCGGREASHMYVPQVGLTSRSRALGILGSQSRVAAMGTVVALLSRYVGPKPGGQP